MTADTQPFLRWAGSKRKQLPVLRQFWKDDFNRYVEPFMGSACLFFALKPERAVLADINVDLVRTFLSVRDHPAAVLNRLAKIPLGKRSYYAVRRTRLAGLDPVDAAANFIYLNRFCFNGLYRTNEQGCFNVPYGGSETGRLPTREALNAASKALKNCEIKLADFEETMRSAESGDFIYLDPPYAVKNRRVFTQYGPSSFGLHDLRRLGCALRALDRKGVNFVLSYAYCREALENFKHWPHRKIFIQRNIAGFFQCRRMAAELLISNIRQN